MDSWKRQAEVLKIFNARKTEEVKSLHIQSQIKTQTHSQVTKLWLTSSSVQLSLTVIWMALCVFTVSL